MNVVDCQVFCRAAIGTAVAIPSEYVFSPHTLRIRSAKGEEILHKAAGSFHELIVVIGLLGLALTRALVLGFTVVAVAATVGRGFLLDGLTFGGVGVIHTITVTVGAFLPIDLVQLSTTLLSFRSSIVLPTSTSLGFCDLALSCH